MKKKLEKKYLTNIRILSILAIVLLVLVELYNIYLSPNRVTFSPRSTVSDCENILSIVLFTILIIYPQKIEFFSFISFYYSIDIIVSEKNNPMGIIMYFLGISVLYARGFFIKKKSLKLIFIFILLFVLIFINTTFNKTQFCSFILDTCAYLFLLTLIIFFVQFGYANNESSSHKVLNLAEFSGLKEEDIPLLQGVLDNKQYKLIASELKKTEGTIRNRLNRIYDILQVWDKQGFIACYYDCKIVFKEIKNETSDSAIGNL